MTVEQAITSVRLPEFHPSNEAELFAPKIIYFPNQNESKAMDIALDKYNPEQQYEDACFTYLRDTNPNLFLLGPHYIDWVFGKSSLADEARMDAMGFAPLPFEEGVVLRSISEFKSGKSNGIVRKMQGISNTLDVLRKKPALLQDMLNSLGASLTFPKIYIPQDQNIDVKFISPTPKQLIKEPMPFKIDYIVVPHSETTIFPSLDIELTA